MLLWWIIKHAAAVIIIACPVPFRFVSYSLSLEQFNHTVTLQSKWASALQILVQEHSSNQNGHSRNIMSALGQVDFSHLRRALIYDNDKRFIRQKKGLNFLLLPLQGSIMKGVFRYASSDLDWGQWEGRPNTLCSKAWVTFSARFETVDVSDFFSFIFRSFDEKAWHWWGDKKQSKGERGVEEDKRNGGGGHRRRKQMKGWRDGFSLSARRSPLASTDDAISRLHGDRCQEAAGPLGRRGIKGAAWHLPVHLRMCASVCAHEYNMLHLELISKDHTELRRIPKTVD